MELGKVVLVGGVVVLGVLLYKHSQAQAATAVATPAPGGATPPTPPPGAASMSVPPGPKNPTGLTLTLTQWPQAADASGQQAGIWALVQNAAAPQADWVVVFGNTATKATGVVQTSGTQNAGLIAQAFVAGLLAQS